MPQSNHPAAPSRPLLSPRGRRVLIITLTLIVLALILYRLEHILTPLLISILVAYILDPLVDWIERKGIPRLAIVIGVYVLLIATIVLVLILIVPNLVKQIDDLAHWATEQYREGKAYLQAQYPDRFTRYFTASEKAVSAYSTRLTQQLLGNVGKLLGSAFSILNLVVLIPLYTFFFLWRFDYLVSVTARYLPRRHKARIVDVVRQINGVVASFFRGRLIVCLVVGLATAIGFAIVGVPFAWPLGLAIGLLNFVPYLAPVVGLPIALLITYLSFHDWTHPLAAAAVYGTVQAVDNFVLTPIIQGKLVGLHPITVIVIVFIGADLAGLLGLILAIPAAAAIKILFKEFLWPQIADAADIEETPGAEPPATKDRQGPNPSGKAS